MFFAFIYSQLAGSRKRPSVARKFRLLFPTAPVPAPVRTHSMDVGKGFETRACGKIVSLWHMACEQQSYWMPARAHFCKVHNLTPHTLTLSYL